MRWLTTEYVQEVFGFDPIPLCLELHSKLTIDWGRLWLEDDILEYARIHRLDSNHSLILQGMAEARA